MFTVTDSAKEELEGFFADKEKASVRVYLAAGGWSGPRLALALDEPHDSDKVFEEQGFTFCMDTELYEKAEDVAIDAGVMGFIVTSTQPMGEGKGCAGCTSCG